MITYQNTPWRQRAGLIVLVVVAGVAGGTWWWSGSQAQPRAPQAATVPSAVHVGANLKASDSAILVAPTLMDDGRPNDFSPDDWAALKLAVSKTPNPPAELERVVRYLRFQKGFEQWQSLEGSGDQVKRHQLAQRLLDQVPERLQQSEVTYGEATLLQSALLADLETDEGLRKQKLETLQAQLKAASPQADPQQAARDEELEREYKRREAAIVSDYQSRPEGQRNHEKFEHDLDAARRAVWGGKK